MSVHRATADAKLVMERLGSLREPAAFGGWLAAIARTRALDYVRRTPATEALPDDVQGGLADDSEAVWILAAIREPAFLDHSPQRICGVPAPDARLGQSDQLATLIPLDRVEIGHDLTEQRLRRDQP